MKKTRSYKTNNGFSTAFHAIRLKPHRLIDLDAYEPESDAEFDWDQPPLTPDLSPPPVYGSLRGQRAA